MRPLTSPNLQKVDCIAVAVIRMGVPCNRLLVLVFIILICAVQYLLLKEIIKLPTISPATSKDYALTNVHMDERKPPGHAPAALRSRLDREKVAVLLPYLGKSLPSWFDLFAFTAGTSAELVDWYIFITEAPMRQTPSNVHLIRLSRGDIFRRLAKLDDKYSDAEPNSRLQAYLQRFMEVHPYILVEIKPALGFLFSDYLQGYSHWAYADLDLLVGRMHLQLTPDVLARHDVVTLTFGDNNRLYMRGQFTLHKNNEMTRTLWKGCSYLTDVGDRLEAFFLERKHWDFHSAEGCYSRVVADDRRLSVLYLPIQFSDAFGGPLDEKETLLLGGSLQRCYGQPASEGIVQRAYHPTAGLRDMASSERHVLRRIPTADAPHCSYWIDPADQVCTEFVPPNASIFLEQGLMSHLTEHRLLDGHCREASVAHFQAWKHSYHTYTARLPPDDAHAMVISEAGVVPLKLLTAGVIAYGQGEYASTLSAGRLRGADIVPTNAGSVRNLRSAHNFMHIPRLSTAVVGEAIATVYCLVHSVDLHRCEQPVFGNDLAVLPATKQKDAGRGASRGVTLISVGWLSEYQAGQYDRVFPAQQGYDGPQIVVLAHTETTEALRRYKSHLHEVTVILVNISRAVQNEAAAGQRRLALPDKTLFNIGVDAAGTDCVLLTPSGVALWHVALPISPDKPPVYRPLRMADIVRFMQDVPQALGFDANGLSTALVLSSTLAGKFHMHGGDCGSEQPEMLQLNVTQAAAQDWVDLPFSGLALSQQHTLMMAVAFDRTGSPHGRDFARFPEELNGVGCHDAFFLRALAGSGYKLAWAASPTSLLAARGGVGASSGYDAPTTAFVYAGNGTVGDQRGQAGQDAELGEALPVHSCGCVGRDNGKAQHDFVLKANKFFQKAVELRHAGISNTFSRERFGITMELSQIT